MAGTADLLTPTEAAVVSRVALRDVNRAIDENILPRDFFHVGDGRSVLAAGCSLISFYFAAAHRLTSVERLRAIKEVAPRLSKITVWSSTILKEDWTVQNEFLTIDLAPFLRAVAERLGRLAAARKMVVASPEVLGGTPVIRGARVPVYDVAASAAAGISMDRILAAYPSIDAEKVELAQLYAEANPARGRPRREASMSEHPRIVSHRNIARRRKAG